MITLGLTGCTASGKSTVARLLAKHGFVLINADQLGHDSYAPNRLAYKKIVDAFGATIVASDGTINRTKLGKLVFNDRKLLKVLTDIVWPEIKQLAHEQIEQLKNQPLPPDVVLEAAILLEAGWEDLVDEVWAVITPRNLVLQRALARDQITRQSIDTRLRTQLDDQERIARAHVCIHNDRELSDLQQRVEEELNRLRSRTC